MTSDIDAGPAPDPASPTRHASACILCECNCGIEITLDGRRLAGIRGDHSHPGSQGYACEKAQRLDRYQSDPNRLTTPMRRRADGSHEPVSWEVALSEIANQLERIRDEHGGERILFYGGGGQGNHLGRLHASAFQAALGSTYYSNALAQEKTGEMWVDAQLYGGHTKGDFEHAEVVVFVGKNPWQTHSFPRARPVLKELAADPDRCMVVIDPRRSETAAMADEHLQVRPGTDAFCLAALDAILVQEDLLDHDFLAEHTTGIEPVLERLAAIDVPAFADRCGVPEVQLRRVARRLAAAASACTYEDLGIQQAPHSTLSSYLNKLLWILTGNFAKPGAMFLHSSFAPIAGSSMPGASRGRRTPVTGARIVAGLIPCNSIAEETLGDHPDRFRAMWLDSVNPVHSLAGSARFREAMASLELSVVVDVAMTETAREADYVLPAASQFEKWECTFFNVDFPDNVFQLRRPLMEPLAGTRPEPEIYAELIERMGLVDAQIVTDLRAAAAGGREGFAQAFFGLLGAHPELMAQAPYLLYASLGAAFGGPDAATAAIWGMAQLCALTHPESVQRAGHHGEGFARGEALFAAIRTGRGVVFTRDEWPDTWRYSKRPDRRITAAITELLAYLDTLPDQPEFTSPEWPFVLSAGERRSYTANTIIRDPSWRKRDAAGALRINPEDAARLGVSDGGRVRLSTRAGSAEATVELTDTLQPGHISIPNGLGVAWRDDDGHEVIPGVAPNELTWVEHRDPFTGVPLHKHVPARLEALPAPVLAGTPA